MKRALRGMAVVLAALALTACAARSSSGESYVVESTPMTPAGALGITGAVLLIPVAVGVILFFSIGFDYEYGREHTEQQKRLGRIGLCGAAVILGVCCVLWIAAIWMGVMGG